MKNKLKLKTITTTVLLALSLVACSSGPSDAEVKSLVQKEMARSFGGMVKVTDVKKLGCKADGDAAYKCDVEVQLASGEKKDTTAGPMRFIKTSAGWTLTK